MQVSTLVDRLIFRITCTHHANHTNSKKENHRAGEKYTLHDFLIPDLAKTHIKKSSIQDCVSVMKCNVFIT